jgi:mannose-6-phosphate isomerase
LAQVIADNPLQTLGPEVAARFQNQLPYLFKVLDARKMLSIQAHPTLEQAAEGFEKDHRAGIELHAPHRNYKDRNHKPEVHVALTPFWMLHGFRPLEEIATTLHEIHEFHALMPDFGKRLQAAGTNQPARQTLLRDLYQTVMTLPQERVDALLDPLLDRLRKSPPASKDDPRFWALRAAGNFPLPGGHRDRGILSIFLLNLVRLAPGQATFQPAGTLHAYLEGVNVELMANSDNVLRGGLTPKHIDVPELLRVLKFDAGKPEIINGEAVSAEETVYATPAAEYRLSRLTLGSGHSCQIKRDGPQILIVLEGSVTARAGGQVMELQRGQIMFVPHQLPYKIEAKSEPAQLFLAAVP